MVVYGRFSGFTRAHVISKVFRRRGTRTELAVLVKHDEYQTLGISSLASTLTLLPSTKKN